MSMSPDPRVKELVEVQKRLGLRDADYAKRLGVSREHLVSVRRGRYRLGPKVELGLARLLAADATAVEAVTADR